MRRVINPCFTAGVFNNPAIGKVTTKTPTVKPHPTRQGGGHKNPYADKQRTLLNLLWVCAKKPAKYILSSATATLWSNITQRKRNVIAVNSPNTL